MEFTIAKKSTERMWMDFKQSKMLQIWPRKKGGVAVRNLSQKEQMFDMGGRDETDNKVARAIYACGIPFNVVRSPYWKDRLRAMNDAPKGYVGPNFEKVRTILLRKEKLMVEKILEPVQSCWSGTGVSIISDGWTDIANRPLVNIIVMSPSCPYFLKAIDASGRRRTLIGLLEKLQKKLSSWALQMLCKSSKIMHVHAKQLGNY